MRKLISRLLYRGDSALCENPQRRSMDLFIAQGMLGTASSILLAGVSLTAYLIWLGASDILLSFLGMLPSASGILTLFVAAGVDSLKRRRAVSAVFLLLGKVFLLLAMLTPLFLPASGRIPASLALLVFSYASSFTCSLAFNAWFNARIPEDVKGRYFSARQACSLLVSMALPVLIGWYLDLKGEAYAAYLFLSVTGFLLGCFEVLVVLRVEDAVMPRPCRRTAYFRALLLPMRNKRFMRHTLIMCGFALFLNMSGSFCGVYILRYLGVSYAYYSAVITLSAVAQLFFYSFWGRVMDRLGAAFTLAFVLCFFVVELTIWFHLKGDNHQVILPLLYLFIGMEGPGLAVSGYYRRYETMPGEGRAAHDAFFLAAYGAMALISPVAGGFLRDKLGSLPFIARRPFGAYRAPFLVSALCLLALQAFHVASIGRELPGGRLFTAERRRVLWQLIRESLPARRQHV